MTLLSPRIWYTGRHLRDVELSLPVVGCSQSYCAWCSVPCPIQTAQSQPSALGGGFAYILKCNRHAYSEGSFLKLSQAALVATRLHEGLPLLIQLTNNPMDFPASCTPSHILRYLMNRHCDRQSISRSRYVSSPEMLGNDCVSINGEILEILLYCKCMVESILEPYMKASLNALESPQATILDHDRTYPLFTEIHFLCHNMCRRDSSLHLFSMGCTTPPPWPFDLFLHDLVEGLRTTKRVCLASLR